MRNNKCCSSFWWIWLIGFSFTVGFMAAADGTGTMETLTFWETGALLVTTIAIWPLLLGIMCGEIANMFLAGG